MSFPVSSSPLVRWMARSGSGSANDEPRGRSHTVDSHKRRRDTSSSSSSSSSPSSSRSSSSSPDERRRKKKSSRRASSSISPSPERTRHHRHHHHHHHHRHPSKKRSDKDKRKSKHKTKEKKKARRSSPVRLSQWKEGSDSDNVIGPRSVVSGRLIKMKIKKTKEERQSEKNRAELRRFLNESV